MRGHHKLNSIMSSDKNFLIIFSTVIFLINFFFFNLDLYLILLSLVFLLFAFKKPNIFHLLNYLIFKLGHLFLLILQPFILRFIYFLIFGFVGLLMRLFNYDPFKLKQIKKESFWLDRKKKPHENIQDLKNQY